MNHTVTSTNGGASLQRRQRARNVGLLTLLLAVSLLAVAPSSSHALSAGRVYEMVSPLYKGGYSIFEINGMASDGEAVAFNSVGVFSGEPSNPLINEYLARRGSADWSTVPTSAPVTNGNLLGYSPGLDLELYRARTGTNAARASIAPEEMLMVHNTGLPDTIDNWTAAGNIVLKAVDGGPVNVVPEGASSDMCHLVFSHAPALMSEAVGAASPLYDLFSGCEGRTPSLTLVDVKNKGGVLSPECSAEPGISTAFARDRDENEFNAIAAKGRAIFFTTCIGSVFLGVHQLFVRLDGSHTLEVSRPIGKECTDVPCAGAEARPSADFQGASEDGSKVFFTTAAPLVKEEDQDQGRDLYMAVIGCPSGSEPCEIGEKRVTSLIQLSHDPNAGEAADVKGVVAVSSDGSRAYFVATGVLSGPNVEGHSPVSGALNLYVHDVGSARTTFVGDLAPGDNPEGNAHSLWGSSNEAQTAAPDGRYLVFSTYARLLKSDTDNAKDVYRYDAEAGTLQRVSIGEAGHDANGNRSDVSAESSTNDATIASPERGRSAVHSGPRTRAVSEDGTRIVFTTAEPLSLLATNNLANVYEWHQTEAGGEVSIISSGDAEEPEGEGRHGHAVISPSGRDVFYITTQGWAAQDTDGLADVYDARLGGGFGPVESPREPCLGDACQGPLTNPAPLLVPGSVPQAELGNERAAPKTRASKRKAVRRRPGAHRRRHGHHPHGSKHKRRPKP